MQSVVRRSVSLALVICALLSQTACNTVQGVGEDIQAGGKGLSHAASAAK